MRKAANAGQAVHADTTLLEDYCTIRLRHFELMPSEIVEVSRQIVGAEFDPTAHPGGTHVQSYEHLAGDLPRLVALLPQLTIGQVRGSNHVKDQVKRQVGELRGVKRLTLGSLTTKWKNQAATRDVLQLFVVVCLVEFQ